jgi:hypothetical protein
MEQLVPPDGEGRQFSLDNAASPEPFDSDESAETRDIVVQGIAALREPKRTAFFLRVVEGLSPEETVWEMNRRGLIDDLSAEPTAEEMDQTKAWISLLVFRARAALVRWLHFHHPEWAREVIDHV